MATLCLLRHSFIYQIIINAIKQYYLRLITTYYKVNLWS